MFFYYRATTLEALHSLHDVRVEDVVDLAPHAVRVGKVGHFRPPAGEASISSVRSKAYGIQEISGAVYSINRQFARFVQAK